MVALVSHMNRIHRQNQFHEPAHRVGYLPQDPIHSRRCRMCIAQAYTSRKPCDQPLDHQHLRTCTSLTLSPPPSHHLVRHHLDKLLPCHDFQSPHLAYHLRMKLIGRCNLASTYLHSLYQPCTCHHKHQLLRYLPCPRRLLASQSYKPAAPLHQAVEWHYRHHQSSFVGHDRQPSPSLH